MATLGVDAVGVIAVRSSPRWLEPEARPSLFAAMAQARPACRGVLVVANPANEELEQLSPSRGHQVVQLHGQESPARCEALGRELGCALWKALRIRSPEDLERARGYLGVVEAVLLDAWVPDQLGGSGQRLPVEWLRGFEPGLPWWLAGGITPENAAGVLRDLSPFGLDASSGVEVFPGEKNLERVEQLVHAVREAG